jgi:DNA-binding NarL/FixJ family response regulator
VLPHAMWISIEGAVTSAAVDLVVLSDSLIAEAAVAQRLVLSQRAVEKHINSIFAKLGLTIDDAVDRRVKAVLMFLDDVSA